MRPRDVLDERKLPTQMRFADVSLVHPATCSAKN